MRFERVSETEDTGVVHFGLQERGLIHHVLHSDTELGGSGKQRGGEMKGNASWCPAKETQSYFVLCVHDSITPVSVLSDSRW